MKQYLRHYPTKLGVIKAIKKNYQLIENNQFDELYNVLDEQNHYKINAPKELGGGSYIVHCNIGELYSSVTQWLLAHNKNPLDYMSQVYDSMFYNRDIKQIKLKNNIKSIGYCAFYKCEKLKKVIFLKKP